MCQFQSISLIRIKGTEIGDHEIEAANSADNTTIFFRNIT